MAAPFYVKTIGIQGISGPPSVTQAPLLSSFTQPLPGTPVTINVTTTAIAAPGNTIQIPIGGSYSVLAVVDSTHLSVTPIAGTIGLSAPAAPGTIIASGVTVSLAGAPSLGQDAYGNAIIPASGYTYQYSPTAGGYEFGTDWPGGATAGDGQWHTLATIAPPVAVDEIVTLSVLVTGRNAAGSSGFAYMRRFISVENVSGVLYAADGTQADTAIDSKSSGSSPSNFAAQIAVSGQSLVVQASALTSFYARVQGSVDRAGGPATPLIASSSPVAAAVNANAPITISGSNLARCTAAGVYLGGIKYPLSNFAVSGSTTITGTDVVDAAAALLPDPGTP